jgi:hypothetical protein
MFPRAQLLSGPNGIQAVTRTIRNKPCDPQATDRDLVAIDWPISLGESALNRSHRRERGLGNRCSLGAIQTAGKGMSRDQAFPAQPEASCMRSSTMSMSLTKGSWRHHERHAEPAGSSNSVRYEGRLGRGVCGGYVGFGRKRRWSIRTARDVPLDAPGRALAHERYYIWVLLFAFHDLAVVAVVPCFDAPWSLWRAAQWRFFPCPRCSANSLPSIGPTCGGSLSRYGLPIPSSFSWASIHFHNCSLDANRSDRVSPLTLTISAASPWP